jgi:hypothetical protein
MPVTLPSTRKKLRKHQDGVCPLCGGPLREDRTLHASEVHWSTTVDHVWPLSLGGRNGFGNILLAHRACNSAKGGREPYPCEIIWLVAVCARERNAPLRMREDIWWHITPAIARLSPPDHPPH